MKKTALVAGATGLVGFQIVRQLLENPAYDRVIALVRKPMDIQHPKLHQEIFNFDQPDPEKIKGDDLFCALGTTLRKAGSKEAQYKIDCTYPFEIGKIARANGVRQYLLVSSIGADAGSSNFYLRTKGDLEEKLSGLGFDALLIARPAILYGDRQEFRSGERVGIALFQLIDPLLIGSLRKYRGIQAATVAQAMIRLGNQGLKGVQIIESDRLQTI